MAETAVDCSWCLYTNILSKATGFLTALLSIAFDWGQLYSFTRKADNSHEWTDLSFKYYDPLILIELLYVDRHGKIVGGSCSFWRRWTGQLQGTIIGPVPTKLCKRTFPEIPIVIRRYQMPAKVEQITDSRVSTQELLGLSDGF